MTNKYLTHKERSELENIKQNSTKNLHSLNHQHRQNQFAQSQYHSHRPQMHSNHEIEKQSSLHYQRDGESMYSGSNSHGNCALESKLSNLIISPLSQEDKLTKTIEDSMT